MSNGNMIDLQNSNTNTSFNRFEPGFTDASSMELRINPDPVKAKIQIYLQGISEQLVRQPDGTYMTQYVKIGEPLVNAKGLQKIMMFIELIVSAATVQGNFEISRFDFQMKSLREDLANDLWTNMHDYDLNENYYNGIVDFVFMQMKIFLTRTINNGERNSYGQSLQIKDTSSTAINKKKGAFSFLFGG